MKLNHFLPVLLLAFVLPTFVMAQHDSTMIKKDTTTKALTADTMAVIKEEPPPPPAPSNCYKEWTDAFASRGAKPVTDGMQDVVIAFKNADTYHCFLGRVEVLGGKIKAPLYVQTENGEYKTFSSISKKLDPEFIAAAGDQLWKIADGMSALFKTADNEYGRLFFYKFVSKGPQSNKTAPSPAELIKD